MQHIGLLVLARICKHRLLDPLGKEALISLSQGPRPPRAADEKSWMKCVEEHPPHQYSVETWVCLYGTHESFNITHHISVIVLCKYDQKKKIMSLTAAQLRAARALLDWTQPKLAEAAKLSVPTIRRMESDRGPSASTEANVDAVRRALEKGGVLFLGPQESAEGGAGVRLKE